MILDESLFENYGKEWIEVDSKSVPDSDGFMTDYTWYTNGEKHIFMFGDKDLYEPDEDYADWEVEIYPGNEQNAQDEAQEWFDGYKGFEDEELNESTIIEDEDDIANIVNYLFGGKPLPKHISEEDVEEFNLSQAADYVYYRQWENDNRITSKAVEELEARYNEMMGEDEEILEEDFSPSLPKWLVNYLNSNKKVKQQLSNSAHLDLANMQYVKVPKDKMPTNGFHPLFKDETKQFVYLLRDNEKNIVYLPGLNDNDTSLAIDPDDIFKTTPISYISKKKLLDYTVQLGYIEGADDVNRNTAKQQERKNAKKGSLMRGQGQYYSTSGWSRGWVVPGGQDKSGYPIDKDKYKNMLDQADMTTYSKQYVRYTKKLDALRNAIIEYMINMPLDKSIGSGWGSGIQYAIRYFEDAIYSFEKLQEAIERILTNENLTDEEKNHWIQEEFDGSKSFNSITDLRVNIEKSWKELNNFKDKALKKMDESLEDEVDEDPMAKLAKKHNLDILTPMGVEPGSMRVSGTVRDLDNFYKEAEAAGLLKLEESQEKILDEKLTMHDFPEFKEIAEEVGLVTAEDLERFRKEEMQPGESELDAIKRYRDELVASGVDLSMLKNESLTEGAVKDLDLDLQNGESFESILKSEFILLKKQLQYLEDYPKEKIGEGNEFESSDELNDAIEKTKKEISQIKAKLILIMKKNQK